jgi:hypothetical protein
MMTRNQDLDNVNVAKMLLNIDFEDNFGSGNSDSNSFPKM